MKRGRGFWRLNIKLLLDTEYCEEMRAIFKEILTDRTQVVRKWEWLKHKIREKSIQFSSARNKSRVNKLALLEKKLKDYEKRLLEIDEAKVKKKPIKVVISREEILKQIEWVEKEMEDIITYKVSGAMLRS